MSQLDFRMSLTGTAADAVLRAQSVIHARTGKLVPAERIMLKVLELGWVRFEAEINGIKPEMKLVK